MAYSPANLSTAWEDLTENTNPWTIRKEVQQLRSTEDLLALSVTWKRLRDNNITHNVTGLKDDELFDFIIEEDRVLAATIRDYYSKKIMMMVLKDMPLSAFRKDMNAFIHSTGKQFTEKDVPMVFRIPEFYEYDTKMEVMRTEIVSVPAGFYPGNLRSLTPVKYFKRKIASKVRHEYWLKTKENHSAMILLDDGNPLQHMWEREFAKDHVTVSGSFRPTKRDGFVFYTMEKWHLAVD